MTRTVVPGVFHWVNPARVGARVGSGAACRGGCEDAFAAAGEDEVPDGVDGRPGGDGVRGLGGGAGSGRSMLPPHSILLRTSSLFSITHPITSSFTMRRARSALTTLSLPYTSNEAARVSG